MTCFRHLSAADLKAKMLENNEANTLFFTQLAAHQQAVKDWPKDLTDDEIMGRSALSFYLFFVQGLHEGRKQMGDINIRN